MTTKHFRLMQAACISMFLLLASSLVLAQSAPTSQPADAAGQKVQKVQITVVHFNDPHGQTLSRTEKGKAGSVGGYARLAGLIQDVRAEVGHDGVLFIHAGDELSRGDELTSKTLGKANFEILNSLAPDVFVPGNGDFYDGMDVLKARIDEAKFPVLAANVAYLADDKCIAKEYVIRQVGPVKIAFLGLCYVRPLPNVIGVIKTADPIETAKRLVPELRKQADIVIAVTHIGLAEDRKLVAAVGGIDVVIGAHSHDVLTSGMRFKNPDGKLTLVCQAGEQLNYAGRLDLTLASDGAGDANKYKLVDAKDKLIALDQAVREEPKTKALIARLWEDAHLPTTQPATLPAGVMATTTPAVPVGQ